MRKLLRSSRGIFAAALVALLLSGCGYNDLQRQDEQIKAGMVRGASISISGAPTWCRTWSIPSRAMPRRSKPFSSEVAEARASVGAIKATPELINDPAAFAKFQAAQAQLQSALSRLLLVAENYPQLKSDAVFRDLTGAARGHRESDHRCAQPLHQGGAGFQRDRALLPDQSHGDDIQDGREAQLHRRQRKVDQRAADGRFRQVANAARNTGAGTRAQELIVIDYPRSDLSCAVRPAAPRRCCRDGGRAARECGGCCVLFASAALAVACGTRRSDGLRPVPPLTSQVTDLTGTLSALRRSGARSQIA